MNFSFIAFDIIFNIVFAFFFSFALYILALKVFPMIGLMDRPEKYGHKRAPIPYPVGAVMSFAIFILILIFGETSREFFLICTGIFLLTSVCFIDDRVGLPVWIRLIMQIMSALCIFFAGIQISYVSDIFGINILLNNIYFSGFITVMWILIMINAFNWTDGVPGMTSGLGFVASGVLLALSLSAFHQTDQSMAIFLSSIVFATSLAFFSLDFPKTRMLMGDSGSMVLGFLLAITALASGAKIATTIIVLAFPLIDFIWVILRRLYKRQSPFKGDLLHFHHRFLMASFSTKQVVLIFILSSAMFGTLALFMQTQGKIFLFCIILLLMAFLALFLYNKKSNNNPHT